MITLLASIQDELWGEPLTPLYLLCIWGGLIFATVMAVIGVVRWFWSGDFKFWWEYERHIRVEKPRKPHGFD